MDIWFEIKAGKRTTSETGRVKETIEASQLAHLTTIQDNLIGLIDVYDEALVDLFKESLKRVKFDLLYKKVNQQL